MDDKCKKLFAKYLFSTIAGATLTFFVLSNRGFFEATDSALKMLYLADAFTIPGVLILMLGVMVWISTKGLFDILTYSLGRFTRTLIPFTKTTDERFGDYKERKSENRIKSYSFMFIVGGVFLFAAIVFTVIHSVM